MAKYGICLWIAFLCAVAGIVSAIVRHGFWGQPGWTEWTLFILAIASAVSGVLSGEADPRTEDVRWPKPEKSLPKPAWTRDACSRRS